MANDYTHFVKVRRPGEHAFRFLAPGGKTTNRRVYAGLYTKEAAQTTVDNMAAAYPEDEWKIQPFPKHKESA